MYFKIKHNFYLLMLLIISLVQTQSQLLYPDDCLENYCYDLDMEKLQRFRFGTKAPYPRYTDFDVNREFKVKQCTPLKMWLLVRHGSRHPASSEVLKFHSLTNLHSLFVKNYNNDRTVNRTKCTMCSADYELLRNWTYKDRLLELDLNHLQPSGEKDLYQLGMNLKKMFPTLFDGVYTREKYVFSYATEQRTRYSYYHFANGAFGLNASDHIPKPTTVDGHNDSLLQPYSKCKPSIKNSETVDSRREQAYQFASTPPFQQLIRDVSFRLGISKPLEIDDVIDIWDFCKYQQTWHPNEPSPWCVAFLPHHYPYLEYYDDIKFYYKKSYGAPVTLKLACAAINNMLYYMTSDDSLQVIGYFIHSTLMQLVYTALGLFKDSNHLRSDNYDEMTDRTFRSSITLPLSSNFAVVKYHCEHKREPFQFMFLLNQKPLPLKWCSNRTLCPLSILLKRYAHFAEMDCDESFCDVNFTGFKNEYSSGLRRYSVNSNFLSLFVFSIFLMSIFSISLV